MHWLSSFNQRTFASLAVRNYRLFFIGQAVSMSGTWMQTVAQGLLVLELTGSGTALGIVTALQTLPVLFLGAWGGLLADRLPKRSILYVTQWTSSIVSLVLGALILAGHVELWMVYVFAVINGVIKVFDNPTRQTFVREMVGNERLTNAVALNSTEMNLARVIGPSIAGVVAATLGLGVCFLVNGVSYFFVIAMLMRMRAEELHPAPVLQRARGQLVAGLKYAWSTPVLRNTLLMMAIIGTFTYEFSVTMPLFAEFTLDSGASGYAALTSAMGVGAVVGGLYTASRRRTTPGMLVMAAAMFGVSVLLVSIAPSMVLAFAAMVVVGFFSITFTSLGNVTLQMASDPAMQGRVMSLWSIAFLGTTPIGGPIMGAIGEHMGARWSLLLGGLAALVAAGIGLQSIRHGRITADVVATTTKTRPHTTGTSGG
jgi:MFS family permease